MATAGGGMMTVTVTLSVVLPPGPVAVRVYVVVSSGETVREPFGSTSPIPGSMLTLSALMVDQLSVLDSPRVMVDGSAEKVTSGGGMGTFLLTSMVIEAPGVPKRKTAK